MITRIKSRRIIQKNGLLEGYVYFENDRILAVTEQELPYDCEVDAGEQYVSPGFIDLHTHGGGGHDFSNSVEDVIEGCNFHLMHGTTSITPTLASAFFADMEKGVSYIDAAMRDARCRSNIIGAHLEGPYLALSQSGAQSPECITEPIESDYTALIERYGRAVARWSYAPERDRGGAFCRYLTQHGVNVSAGHTDATYPDMLCAIQNGCNSVTHLFSCTSTITRERGHRILGVTETALLSDEIYAEIIADGKHLPPELIRLIVKAKGSDRVMLVTDSLSVAGQESGFGRLVNIDFVIEDGVCRLMDRSAFAGSIATTDRLVRVVTKEAGFSMWEAVKMASYVPAEVMKLNKGELAAGRDADILIFDDDVRISHVWVMGNRCLP